MPISGVHCDNTLAALHQGTLLMTFLDASALVALAAGCQISLVIALDKYFGSESQDVRIIGAAPAAARAMP